MAPHCPQEKSPDALPRTQKTQQKLGPRCPLVPLLISLVPPLASAGGLLSQPCVAIYNSLNSSLSLPHFGLCYVVVLLSG